MLFRFYIVFTCGDGSGLATKLCPTLATPRTVAHQAPLSMGFSRQEYWGGVGGELPFPSPGDLPHPGNAPVSPAWQSESLPRSHQGSPVFAYIKSNLR